MAKAYISAGYKVHGFDINQDAINELEKSGGIVSETPAEVAAYTEVILVVVLNDQQVLEVVNGKEGLLNSAKEGSCIICMSTINRTVLEGVASQCQEHGIGLIDCPFTGGPARVPSGSLTLIVAGHPNLVEEYGPILEIIGNITIAGESPGQGQAIKHCNQLLVGVTHAATMEVIRLAEKLSLDPSIVTKVIGEGIAGSDYFRLLSESAIKKTPSPGKLGQMCKDVSIVVNNAEDVGMEASTIKGAATYFELAVSKKMHNHEGADLIEVVK